MKFNPIDVLIRIYLNYQEDVKIKEIFDDE